ncbi:MAG TPA: CBS domain-containing protein [Terriglobia bacterium]|nr:CBS domain-containing protein [Terriglobia bacterium]
MKVKDVMTKEVKCCRPLDSTQLAAKIMRTYDVGAVPVVSDLNTRRLEGIVTDRDLCCTVVAEASFSESVSVQEVMTPKPVMCKPEDSLEECEHLMQKHRIRRIPVVDEAGCCVGIVTQADMALHAPAVKVAKTMAVISKPRPVARRPHVAAA